MTNRAIIFSLTSNVNVTKEVCEKLKVEMGKCDVKHFADGEIIANPTESVRGKRVYVIQSTCTPVTERLMELLIFVDALKRSSAKEITVIIPYYGYARQDRQAKSREPITARLVANLLQRAGIDRVITFDLHSPQIQGFFDCPVDNLSAVGMIGRYLKQKLKKDDVVVVSPDHGGVVRARNLATYFDCPIAIFDKRRPRPNVAEMVNVIGEVSGKTAILIDDIIDTGGTILAAANELIKKGAKKVLVACTHPIFSHDALTNLENSPIERIIVTNTIPLARPSKKVTVLSIGPVLAKVIDKVEAGGSVSPLFDVKK